MNNKVRPLTPLESGLLDFYVLNGGNGTEAARSAGYKGSPEVLKVTASRVLTRANVAAELARRLAVIAERAQIDAAWCIREQVSTYHAARERGLLGQANQALSNAAHMIGAWRSGDTTVNIDARQQVIATLAALPPGELLARLDALSSRSEPQEP